MGTVSIPVPRPHMVVAESQLQEGNLGLADNILGQGSMGVLLGGEKGLGTESCTLSPPTPFFLFDSDPGTVTLGRRWPALSGPWALNRHSEKLHWEWQSDVHQQLIYCGLSWGRGRGP